MLLSYNNQVKLSNDAKYEQPRDNIDTSILWILTTQLDIGISAIRELITIKNEEKHTRTN